MWRARAPILASTALLILLAGCSSTSDREAGVDVVEQEPPAPLEESAALSEELPLATEQCEDAPPDLCPDTPLHAVADPFPIQEEELQVLEEDPSPSLQESAALSEELPLATEQCEDVPPDLYPDTPLHAVADPLPIQEEELQVLEEDPSRSLQESAALSEEPPLATEQCEDAPPDLCPDTPLHAVADPLPIQEEELQVLEEDPSPSLQESAADESLSGYEESALPPPPSDPSPRHFAPAMLELKAGYFFFTPSMEKVYKDGHFDLQLVAAWPWRVCSWLRFYAGVEYLYKEGRSLRGDQKTSIWEVPINFGLQPIFLVYSTQPTWLYFTIGPRYVFASVHNRSSYVPRHMHTNWIGFFTNIGLLTEIHEHVLIDFFGEYSYVKLPFRSSRPATFGHTVQGGVFTFGMGLAYGF